MTRFTACAGISFAAIVFGSLVAVGLGSLIAVLVAWP